MKNSIITLVVFLISNVIFSQTAFDKYDGQDGVASIIVNKKMFQMMSSVKVDANDKETQQYLELIKKLDNLKVFTTSNAKIALDMSQTADKYSKTSGLEELIRVNDGGNTMRILVKSEKNSDQIREILMYSEELNSGKETVLMSLTGNFTLNEVSILTDKMNIPGGEDLKKISNK